MKQKIPTVTIGIPAYNEEVNIKNLLLSILAQKEKGFSIREIIVVSDGSTDKTIHEVKTVRDKGIKLVVHKQRRGKVVRLNQMFTEFKGDILVQFDADIELKDSRVLYELILPFIKDEEIDLVCGRNAPLPPATFVEKLAYFGAQVWEEAKKSLGDKAERYYCNGSIRAFSKNFLREFRLPESIGSTEDVYSYLFAKTHGYSVFCAKSAVVYFRLPSTFKDYTKQMKRFLINSRTLGEFFGRKMVRKYNTITNSVRLKALLKLSSKTPPHIVICYLILQYISKIEAIFYKQKNLWDISTSSKV